MPDKPNLWHVPLVWPEETIVCVGGGPSLTREQVEQCKETARLIVINDAYRLAPLADILYACDARWWNWHDYAPMFRGVRVGMAWDAIDATWYPEWESIVPDRIHFIACTGQEGLEIEDSTAIRSGSNSGYQTINLAVHLGAKRIVLIGYDMQPAEDGRNHWFGEHPDRVPAPPYDKMIEAFETLVTPLEENGVEVINATPESALDVFPKARLEAVV